MIKKAPVLRGDKRVHDIRRQILERDKDAPPFTDLGYQVAIATEDTERDLQWNIADCLGSRQSGLYIIIGPDDSGDRRNGTAGPQAKHHYQAPDEPSSADVTWILVCFPWFMHSCWRFPAIIPG